MHFTSSGRNARDVFHLRFKGSCIEHTLQLFPQKDTTGRAIVVIKLNEVTTSSNSSAWKGHVCHISRAKLAGAPLCLDHIRRRMSVSKSSIMSGRSSCRNVRFVPLSRRSRRKYCSISLSPMIPDKHRWRSVAMQMWINGMCIYIHPQCFLLVFIAPSHAKVHLSVKITVAKNLETQHFAAGRSGRSLKNLMFILI